MENVSMSSPTLQDEPSIEEFFDAVATETLALFEYITEFDMFARLKRG